MDNQFGKLILTGGCILILAACNIAPAELPATVTQAARPELTAYSTRTLPPPVTATPPGAVDIVAPTATLQVHTVKKDELGSEIALHYGVSLAMLQAANPGVDLNYLKEGSTLTIPARSQTPSPILFTPTPVTLDLGQVHCYPTAEGKAWCLVNIRNNQADPVYYLTGDFLLQAGDQVASQTATGLMNVLPAGAQAPLIALLDGPVSYPFQAHFILKTAFQANSPTVRSVAVSGQQIQIQPDGLAIRVTGTVQADGDGEQHIAVVVCGYHGDLPAGIRRLELPDTVQPGAQVPFDLTVYTTGPVMDKVEVYAEAKK
jgi:LysM repeat protein